MNIYHLKEREVRELQVETLEEVAPTGTRPIASGFAAFPRGARVPESGLSSHDQHEISYVIEGRLEVTLEQQTRTLVAGDAACIAANELHASRALEDSKVFWVLCG
ncbi:cupin domain-containing protein [Parahaliea mediterranea]|uniref:Cupin domain-containing protein n=1 Tax=Parahaliea mediterranea TaxID=651086 RepID=A0A939DEE1_9GAMM|nr:cupin domain-containing protein [Parahaliea mediterranea]MBN7796633.1 cupin domain-containing protein [Parahaliea mediterranea]